VPKNANGYWLSATDTGRNGNVSSLFLTATWEVIAVSALLDESPMHRMQDVREKETIIANIIHTVTFYLSYWCQNNTNLAKSILWKDIEKSWQSWTPSFMKIVKPFSWNNTIRHKIADCLFNRYYYFYLQNISLKIEIAFAKGPWKSDQACNILILILILIGNVNPGIPEGNTQFEDFQVNDILRYVKSEHLRPKHVAEQIVEEWQSMEGFSINENWLHSRDWINFKLSDDLLIKSLNLEKFTNNSRLIITQSLFRNQIIFDYLSLHIGK
jgi:hypothetical protein